MKLSSRDLASSILRTEPSCRPLELFGVSPFREASHTRSHPHVPSSCSSRGFTVYVLSTLELSGGKMPGSHHSPPVSWFKESQCVQGFAVPPPTSDLPSLLWHRCLCISFPSPFVLMFMLRLYLCCHRTGILRVKHMQPVFHIYNHNPQVTPEWVTLIEKENACLRSSGGQKI